MNVHLLLHLHGTANRPVNAVEHDEEALERVPSATDPPSQGTRGVSQGTGRLSYATDLVSQATDRGSSATDRVSQATDRGSFATDRVSQATDRGSSATDRVSQATDRGSSATNQGSEAPNRTSSALNRRSRAPERLLSRSNRDRGAQSRCPERNQAATSPPTCVSDAISSVPVERARPIQDLRPDPQATSRAPGARFRDSELDECAKEAAGSATELARLHVAGRQSEAMGATSTETRTAWRPPPTMTPRTGVTSP